MRRKSIAFTVVILISVLSLLFLATAASAADEDNDTQVLADVHGLKLPPVLNGTVLDVTNHLVAVQQPSNKVIWNVYVPGDLPQGLAPGNTVSVQGQYQNGLIITSTLSVTGGDAWPTTTPPQSTNRIDHVIFLIQENHSLDNYFGTYPGVDGLPAGTKLPSTPGGLPDTAPFHFTQPLMHDIDHSWGTARSAYDNGKMDNFVPAEHSVDTMGYYNGSDIPNYWAYARQFTLDDHFFSSLMGPSLPNHLYTVAAQSGGETQNRVAPPGGSYDFETMANLLQASNISWKYYDGKPNPQAFSLWNPLPGMKSFQQDSSLMAHLVASSEYFKDIREGTLPSVAWIVPNGQESEHPPADIQLGMWYTTDFVNALMKSPYWNNTLLVVTWDDYGGFYDHVPPPQPDQYGYGFRVPALLITPYAKSGYIDHTTYDFTSVLRTIENRFQLQPLASRDSQANASK